MNHSVWAGRNVDGVDRGINGIGREMTFWSFSNLIVLEFNNNIINNNNVFI